MLLVPVLSMNASTLYHLLCRFTEKAIIKIHQDLLMLSRRQKSTIHQSVTCKCILTDHLTCNNDYNFNYRECIDVEKYNEEISRSYSSHGLLILH